MTLDQPTLFIVNALLLVVFTCTFVFAALGQRDRRYWTYLAASNLSFAVSFVGFALAIDGTPYTLLIPNILMIVALGLRWQAARAFFGRSTSPVWYLALSLLVAAALLLSDAIGRGLVFGLVNALIAAQIFVIMVSLACEEERLPSLWPLIVGYLPVLVTSFLRALQGLVLNPGMPSLLPSDSFLELNLISAAIHISASGAFSLSMAYERSVSAMREAALRDPLTGLYNRWSIETLPALNDRRRPPPRDTALLLFDLDHFKQVNDTHGHAAGDAAIRHCAAMIRKVFGAERLAARIGGEEFVVLLPGSGRQDAYWMADTLRQAMEDEPVHFDGRSFSVTVSIGISHGAADAESFPDLLRRADACLYRAKREGRNRVEMDEDVPAAAQ